MHTRNFIIYAAGIFVSYFYFGIIQEKVTRGKYPYPDVDENGQAIESFEKYTCSLTLVLSQCFINYLIAQLVIQTKSNVEDKTPKVYYASLSLTYLLAMVSSNMALQWVPYPTQVVGKAAKPIPVMVLGVLLGGKSYNWRKYLFVSMIVVGIVLFMMKDKAASANEESMGVGELLLLLSLTMDGLVGAIQERMRSESKPSGVQMMKTTNAWSVIYLVVAVILTGEIFKFVEFVGRHPSLLYNLLLLGLTSSVGNLFLYSMVSEFGPLPVSIVTTSRKFFTMLGSVIFFGNALSLKQWSGAAIVFISLFLDAYYGKRPHKMEKK